MKNIVFDLGSSSPSECQSRHAQNTGLRVGAAKVDVTPAENELPKSYDGILDHLYSRAIVIDNGSGLRGADYRGCGRDPRRALASRLQAGRKRARNPGQQYTADRDAHAQRAGAARPGLHTEDRRVRPARQAAADARARRIRHGRLLSSTSTATSSTPKRGDGGRGPTTTGRRTRRSR